MSKLTPTTYISLRDAAERLGCSPTSVRRMISRGEIRAHRLGPKMVRINAADIDAALRPIIHGGPDAM